MLGMSVLYGLRRRAESEELETARQVAVASNSAKSQFLANMSHEIRTPMNGILGMAELLKRGQLDDKQRQQVNTIVHSGRALLKIINDILDFSKVEAGKLDLELKPFDLWLCVNDIVELLRPTANAKGLQLSLDIAESLPRHFVGDAGRIRQIVMNLAGNAVKFTDRGSVSIRLSGSRAGRDVGLLIEVIDTGIGIPAHMLADVFEKFNQVDSANNRRHEGTGLGLSISQLLAKRMGGGITARSEFGKGSTFSFSLKLPVHEGPIKALAVVLPLQPVFEAGASHAPRRQGAIMRGRILNRPVSAEVPRIVAPAAATPATPPSNKHGIRVLVVDDSLVNQEVAREFLEDLSCDVEIAKNGEEAVTMSGAARYAIIFMDCQMPVMDGFAATGAIRARSTGATPGNVPIVALTANAFESDRQKCMDAGMSDFLAKPFQPSEIEAAVMRWRPAAMPPPLPVASFSRVG